VPYGQASRFASPAAPVPWIEPRALTERGPICPQLPSRLSFVTGPVTDGLQRSEDCQVLSVTAPNDADGLPVMVWFHGGAYVSGSGESSKYDPDALVAEGRVVVVTVSYRLGIFGYCTPLGVDDDNLGLRDQLLALRWVHDNIAAFGGDPQRVTLFGQSAGGDSVYSLLLSEAADGLCSRPNRVPAGGAAVRPDQRVGVCADAGCRSASSGQ
jgi:para-nitrobenzyl esterase